MNRRLVLIGIAGASLLQAVGCRGYQFGHIVQDEQPNLVGSHAAGAAVFDPLVDESVAKLLGAEMEQMGQIGFDEFGNPVAKSICFVGVENRSAEELVDFKEQLYQQIDNRITESNQFRSISRRMVDAALQETRLRPDSLLIPDNMTLFSAVLQRNQQPFDYLLFATLTSGTTERNSSSQRDYLLTLELVNVNDGTKQQQSAEIRKGYHKSAIGKLWHFNPLKG